MARRLIVEADGGSRGNPGLAGSGAVVIDGGTGEVLAELGIFIGTATNNVAEYHGMLEGLKRAFEIDPAGDVHVRMDSKLVVEQMSGRWKIKHPDMQALASRARTLTRGKNVTFEWIPRAENCRADSLANRAMDGRAHFAH